MIGAHVHRVPVRNLVDGVRNDFTGEAHRGIGREYEGPARQIFFDDVVLGRAAKVALVSALAFGSRDVQREQPGRRRVDRHRRVHLVERNLVEEGLHVFDVADRDADLADFTAGEGMIRVVSGLRREIEGDRETRLTLREIAAIERITRACGRVAGVGPEHPRAIALGGLLGGFGGSVRGLGFGGGHRGSPFGWPGAKAEAGGTGGIGSERGRDCTGIVQNRAELPSVSVRRPK